MKVRALMLTAGAMIAMAVVSPTKAATQVVGTWELSAEGPRGDQRMVLVLGMEGDAVAGTLTMQRPAGRGGPGGGGRRGGPGGGDPPDINLSDGSIDGDTFSFTVTMSMRGNSFTLAFSGTVSGDEMSGTISTPRGDRPFTGKRTD